MSSAWQGISKSDHPDNWNERRADPEHPLNFFRGRDFRGRPMFMLKLFAYPGAETRPPQIEGIDIGIEQIVGGDWQLRLLLQDRAHEDIFGALCANLMEATRSACSSDETRVVNLLLHRLERWQQLLKARRQSLLSRSQIIGLVGELLFQRDVVMRHYSPLPAARAWRGPFRDEQDFVLGNWLIEVKTQIASADRKLKISSEDQLDTSSGSIMICHQTLHTASEASEAPKSLRELVSQLLSTLTATDVVARDVFQSTLFEYGYADCAEYDVERWHLGERRFFEVGTRFPKITPEMLSHGITNVRYSVDVHACAPSEVSQAAAESKIFHAQQ